MLMDSHTLNIASTTYPDFAHPRYADPPVYNSTSPSYHRVRTYTAHALLLFNVYGIPLSSGLWLEYRFTSSYPATSLLTISCIYGAQLACLGLSAGVISSQHHRWPKYWRLHMSLGGLSVFGAQLGQLVAEHLWVVIICQGVLTGLGLGVLGTVSMHVLSSHYKGDVAVASSLCVAAGFSGTIVYTVCIWICLRSDDVKTGYGVMAALLTFTVLPAILLAKPCTLHTPHAAQSLTTHRMSSLPLAITLLTLLSPACLLLPPLLLPLILTRHPTPFRADSGCYVLLSFSLSALLSSTLLPKLRPRRLSPSTLVSASSLLCGIALVPLLWMPSLLVAVPCAVVFGAGMGGVSVFYVKGIAELVAGVGQRGHVLLVVGGVGMGCAVVSAAAILERWDSGVEIVMGAMVACLVLGGLLVGIGVGLRYWEEGKGVSR